MPHTLLLADDSVTIQRVIELTFADEDIRVVAVGDGDQAIALLDLTPPDIVLADVGMPGRNGYEVAQHIKDTPRLAHIPVLLLTGAFEPIDRERAAAAGCDGVLAKPFEPQLVIARVKELLGRPKPIPDGLDAALAPPPAPAPPWTAIFDEPTAIREAVKPAHPAADVGHYFDRLDQAFATLSNASQQAPRAPARSVVDEIDWTGAALARPAPLVDLPLSAPEPDPPFVAPAAAPPAPISMPLAPPPPALPQLADAFAALLAAEQSIPVPPSLSSPAPAWPPPPAHEPVIPVIGDEVIEDIVSRVLARLSDRVVRDAVADIASETAERLVREEIERIKRSIE